MSDLPASRQLLNITKASFDHCEAECERLRALNAELVKCDRDKWKAFHIEIAELRVVNAGLVAALEIIAGERQCVDNLMSNVDIARAALAKLRANE